MKRKSPSSPGFTLVEMIVNLSLLSFLLLAIAALVSRTSETVAGSTGKLTAAEKSETIRRLIAADLAALPSTGEGGLACSSADGSWSLKLRLPSHESAWTDVDYRWTKRTGSLTRSAGVRGEKTTRTVGTGFTAVKSRWLMKPSDNREGSPPSWNRDEPPALLHLELETTRLREPIETDDPSEVRGATSAFRFVMPVGGGPAGG